MRAIDILKIYIFIFSISRYLFDLSSDVKPHAKLRP